ncbi:hypothetical protein C9994_03975 [Marivirga lumbricoides]|uniref:Uncharacterized protein n=1 Tax=Marivirga lumbricoides TaxID=1046115 RepID=A0A2T4DTX4_9BACT|nr:hypothetical protein C9994_03975 [Marivirga lumbricoides]
MINQRALILVLVVVFISSCKNHQKESTTEQAEIADYVDFVKEHKNNSAKEYILNLFDNHDFVIICERDHRDITQYDLYKEIISDPYFINNVGNVFMEIGVKNSQDRINDFIFSENLDSLTKYTKLREIHRNASYYPVWEKYNYSYFMESIYELNQELDTAHKIKVFPSDIQMDWNEIRSYDDMIENYSRKAIRDSLIAENIIKDITALEKQNEGKIKALLILNYHHAFNNQFTLEPSSGNFLFKAYKGRIANVLMNYTTELVESTNGTEVPFQNGKWDAAFLVNGNPSVGFDFKNSPFGKDSFDFYPYEPHNYTYSDIFTGYAFYKPVSEFNLVLGFPGYLEDGFSEEARRRIELLAQWRSKDSTIHIDKLSQREYDRFNKLNYIQVEDLDTIQYMINNKKNEYLRK